MLIFFCVWVWDGEAMWWKVRSIYPEQNWSAFMTWLYLTSCVVFDKFFNYSEFWLPYLLKLNDSYLSRLLQGLNIAINVGIELNTATGLEQTLHISGRCYHWCLLFLLSSLYKWWLFLDGPDLSKPRGLFLFCFVFMCQVACRILAPWPGIKPRSQQWKHWVLTTGPPGNSRWTQFRTTDSELPEGSFASSFVLSFTIISQ